MRKVVAVLVLLMTVLFSGCEYFDNTPGSFHIKFEWNEADKPDFSSKDYYAWVLLEEWPEGDREKAVLLMQTAATPFSKTGKVSIDLSDIKYGENKVIKVEIRGSEKSADRVLYFGRSELFSFSSSDRDKEVKVALQTTATPGTGDDENRFNLKIIQNGNVVSKINNTEVTVRINVVQGNRVILANSLSILEKYLNDKKSVTEGFADKAVSELKVFEGNYYDLENWELNFGLEIAEDAGGERIVYGKLLNDDGYMSETVQVSVVVDKTAPGIINPAVTPNPAKLGDIVTAVFSFTEPVDAEKLDLNWDGLNFAESESVTENVFTYTFKVDENTEERNYTLEGRAYDEIGNGPVTFTIGALTVDRTLPSISDETVSVTDDKSAIRTGDTVTVTFKVSEELEKEPEVTVDGKKFKRVGDSADPYTFSYTVSDTDIEGIKTVLVSLSDLARNQNVVEMEQPVKFDLSAPEVINPTVTPAGEPGNAGIGTKIEVRFNISEPVTELKFLVNGEDSELFNQTVSGLTYSYSRTVENNESASQYVFSVSAVDAAGNTLEPYTLGTVDIDVGMPSVLAQTLSKTNVKLLEVFTLDLEFSEELKSLTVLVGSKDISSGCVKSATDLKKYNCTHTANADSDEGDGVKQFSVQMTDMSGNSSTVQLKKTGGSPLTIEYDVTPPAVVNPVIAPSKANSDSTVDVRFSFTEDVENVVMAWDGLEFIRDNSESDKKLFIYKHKVVPADEEKSYTIKILEAFDIAGNPIASEFKVGDVEIDNTPPEIFNTVIKVSDDPLRTFVRENELISISFEVKEDLSDYAVRIGLKKLSVCTNEDITGGKRYTCTYSTPSSVDGEGTKDVTVEVKDPAGNGTSYAVGQLTYDMSDPQLSSAIVIPERVNSSHSEVKVQFSFSEDVQINVDEVYVAAENFGPELILNCNTGSGYTKQYTCTYSFLESDTRVENYDVSVDLMDAAGNKVTGMFIGKIESDREKPYLSVQNISPVAVRQNEQFTVTFTVNEELAAKPVVKIGDKQIDESSCAGSINYTCQHKANEDGDETDGVKSVTVSLRDPAGNTNIVNLSQTVTYDATRPELLNPVIIPEGTANRYNSKIQVRFSFSEKIDYPASFSFTAESSNSLPVPEFVCTPSNENHQSFSCEGSYETSDTSVDTLTFKVAAKDIAGNALTVDESPDIVGTLKVDRENPVASYTSITPENIIKSTASVTVVFDVSEDTAEPPVVNLGELVKTVPDNLDGNRYTYIFNDFSMLSDGDVIVSVSLTDIAGNINSSPYSGNVTADRTVPSVISKTIAPTIANMNTESVTVNFTFNEKVDSFSKNDVTMLPSGILTDYACSNSSGDEQNYSCVFSMSTVGTYEGLLTFSVEAVDKAGNAMVPNPVELGTLTIDTIAPELTFDSITPLTVNEDAASVTAVFTVDKVPFGNPVVRINSEKTMDVPTDVTNEGKTFTYTFTDLSGITDGNKNIYVELKDDSGNSFEGISAEQILFDRSAPTVVSKNVAPAVVNKDATQITISFTFSEKMTALVNGDVTVSPAGLPAHNCTTADNQSYTCTVDVSTLGTDKDGTYTYSVSGSDQYGNAMSAPSTLGTVTIDRSDLEIAFGSFDPAVVSGSTAEVEVVFTLSETPLESPIVKLAGTKTKTTPSNVTGLQYTYTFDDLSGITDGEKGITITVKDGSGNSITEDFTGPLFDRSAPTVVSKNVAPAVVNKDTTQITISFTFSEKMTALVNGDVTVSPSGLPAHNCTTADNQSYTCTVDVSTLGTDKDGIYTYSVSGSDQYGNPMSSPETIGTVTVDRSDLEITFGSFDPAVVSGSTSEVEVVFTLSETPLESPIVKLAGTKTKTVPSNVSGLQYTYTFDDLSGITDGEKGITITVKDGSGNSITEDFTGPLFDRTSPAVVSKNIAPAVVNKDTTQITISFTFSEKMTALVNGDVTVSPSGLPAHNCTTADNQSYTCTVDVSTLGTDKDGIYTYSVSGSDQYGNPMSSPETIGTVTVDRTDATVTFNSVTPTTVKASTASIAVVFTVSETLGENPVVTIGSELSGNTPSNVSGLQYTYVFNDFSMLSDGLKTVNVVLTDSNGNTDDFDYGTQIIVDRTLPTVLSSTVAPSIANEGTSSVTLNFIFSEKIQGFVKGDVTTVPSGYLTSYNCVNSSGDEQTYSCTYDTSSLGEYEGIFTFHVEAEDKSGNPMAVNPLQIGALTVDRNAPELTFDSVTPSVVNIASSSVTVVFTVDDVPAGNPVVKIGTEKTKSTPSSVTNGGKTFTYIFSDLTGISDGNKDVTVDLQDDSGNPVSAVWSGTLKFDRTAPQMISSTVAPPFVNKTANTLNISFSYSEPMAAFVSGNLVVSPSGKLPAHSCSAIDGNNQTISCTINTSGLNSSADGLYTFTLTGTDVAGNPMESSATAGFTEVDRTSPGITLNSITPETVNSSVTSVTVVFTVTETLVNNPVVKIGSEKTLTTPESVAGLQYTYKFTDLTGITDGPKTLNIQGKDIASNIESKDFTNLFFDRTAPSVVSKNVAPAVANSDTDQIVVSFTFSEKMTALTNGNVTVAPAGLPAHNCTSSDTQSYSCIVDISALGNDKDGTYTYSVSGSDQYGNPMSSAETLGSVTVDRTDPVISFTSALPTTVNSTTPSVTVKFSVSETPQSNPVVKLGTTKQLDTPSSISGLAYTYVFSDLSGISDGEKTVNISLKDTKGNPASGDYAGPVFDRTLPTVMNSFASPVVVNGSNDLFYINITFSEKMQAMVNGDITVSPSGILPSPVCGNPSGDLQTFRCGYNIAGMNVDETYTFSVTADDTAWNRISPDPVEVATLEIDRTDPSSLLTSLTVYDQGTATIKNSALPARGGDVVLVAIQLSEDLSSNPIALLGTRPMTLQGASCLSGTCYFARTIDSSDGDGTKGVSVEMEDEAGNSKINIFPSQIVIDTTPPEMHSNFMTPANAKLGDTIEVKFKFSEPVNTSLFYVSSTITFTKDTGQSTDTNFVYTASVGSSTPAGAVNFYVATRDPAGNWTNGGSWLLVGSVTVDKTAPGFSANTCDVTVSSGYTNPAGIKAVKAGQTVTANCNITANETIKGNPVLKVGGYAATRQGSCPGGYNNCYIYTVAGTEGDGNKVITSEVEDLAGNITASSTGQQVSFDFTPPQLVYYNIFRTPDIEGSTEGQMIHVSAYHPISQQSTVVTFQLFADEHIDAGTVSLVSSPAGFSPLLSSVNNNIAEFNKTVLLANSGIYTFSITWRDKLGNTSGTIPLDWSINANNDPTSGSDIDIDRILFTRVPYGSEDTEGLPRYILTGSAGAVTEASIASIAAYTLSGSIAGHAAVMPDGSFSMPNMSSGNVAEIFVNPIRKSGASMMPEGVYDPVNDFIQVRKTRYISSMGYKTAGSDLNNPNDWYVTKTDKYSVEYVGTNTSTEADGGLLSRLDANPLESGTASKWILAGRNEHPGASNRTVMCYDSKRGKIVLFGGMYDFYSNETWEWYDGKWVRALVDDPEGDGEPVEAIFGHMAYDNKRGVCVYFGGLDKNGNVLDKIWEWNGRSWKRVFTTDPEGDGNPKGIYGGGFAYDNHRNVMVLAGGVYGASNWWVYEYDGVSWRKMPSVLGSSPSSSGGKMVYDRNRRVMVFAGGGNQDDETLEYAGQKFIQVCGTGTSCTGLTERSDVMMAYDAKRKVTVYFGGVQSGTATNTINEWNGTSWVTKNPTGDKPAAREEGAMVYHEGRQTVILYGGVNGSTKYNDTWEWNGTVWKRLSNADETWAYPFAKTGFAIGYDEARGVAILHGGNSGGSVLSETWEWNGYGWKKLAPSTTVYREDHTLVYDTSSQKLLMFGGTDNGTPALYRNEVYEWSGTNWVLKSSPTGSIPSGRVNHSAAYDSVRNRMVIFGGRNSSGTILRQLYEWDNATQTWVYRNNLGPEPRINAGMVYDPVKQRTIVFGGMNYNVSPETYGDTWEYNNSTNGWSNVVANPWTWGDNYPGPGCPSAESWCWKNSSATESPMPRWGHIMVYDPAMRRTIVSGGMTFEDWSEGIYFTAGDTWIYDSATVSWRELEVINKNAFGDRTNIYLHKGFYDTNKNEIVSWSGVKGMQSDQVAYFNTNILRTGASETPSQMFTVSLDAAGLTEEYAWKDISSINLKVYAGATVYSGTSCAEVNGVILYGWADDRWLLLDQSPAPRSSVTELTFSINKPEMISKMLNGESSELYFKIETKGKAGCGNNDEPLLAVDYAEISVDIKEDSIKERYYVSTSSATWAEARADCISRGMDLAVISSQKEADLIESIITTTRYWIGLYEPSVEGEWEWVNGLKAWSGGTDGAGKTWTKWAVDSNNGMYKPNDTANLNCAIFYNYLSRIFWDWTCGSTTRYICEKRDYSYSGASGSKFTNQTACNNMGGDLVSVNSELEEDAIWPHVVQATNYQYIGLTNMSSSDNIYSWNDGDVCWDGNSGTTGTAYGYTNWGTSQPDSTSTDCVAYSYTMDKWYDYSCYYSTWSGICEFD